MKHKIIEQTEQDVAFVIEQDNSHVIKVNSFFSDYMDQLRLSIPHIRLKTTFNLEQIMEFSKVAYNSITKKAIEAYTISDNSFSLDEFSIEFLNPIAFDVLYSHLNAEGVAISREKKAVIRENNFMTLMSVIGHEVGHLTTRKLKNQVREEAKAYAFSYAWTNDIAARNPKLMKDYEAELACPVFYPEDEIVRLMARDAGYIIHIMPGIQKRRKNLYDTPFHKAAREIVAKEIKKGISAMELYQMILEDEIPMPVIAKTGAVGIRRDGFIG